MEDDDQSVVGGTPAVMHMRWVRPIDVPLVHSEPGSAGGVDRASDVELATADVTPVTGASAGHSESGSSAQLMHVSTTTSAAVRVR